MNATTPAANEKPISTLQSLTIEGFALLRSRQPDKAWQVFNNFKERFPDNPGGYLGLFQVAKFKRNWNLALKHLEICIERFPHPPQPAWISERGQILVELNRLDEAEELFQKLKTKHSGLPDGYAGLALTAQSQHNLELALERWNDCLAKFPYPVRFEWLHNKSILLLRLEQYDKAEVLFRELISINPGSPAGYVGLAQIAENLHETHLALQRWEACIALFPDPFRPEWMSAQAQLLADLGRVEDAGRLFETLINLYTTRASALIGLARLAMILRDHDHAKMLWEQIYQQFKEDQWIRLEYIKNLSEFGEYEQALSLCQKETKDSDALQFQLLLCSLYLKMQDIPNAKKEIAALKQRHPEDIELRLREITLLNKYYSLDKLQTAIDILEQLESSFPDKLKLKINLIEHYIRAGRFQEACRMIDALPEKYHSLMKISDFRVWAHLQNGDIDKAKQLCWSAHNKIYEPALHAPVSLKRIDKKPIFPKKDEIFLFCHIKDNITFLPWFLNYYRDLGIDRFFIVDNNSIDGTSEFLIEQPDVHVFWTQDNYAMASSGMRWVNELIQRFGDGHWCIWVDSDEALVFPEMEDLGIRHLLQYMERNRHEAMYAFMLDMYPSTVGELFASCEKRDLIAHSPYFDNNYRFFNNFLCPYRTAHGGARTRLFGKYEVLSKIPITKGGSGVKYLGAHGVTTARISDATGALLHFALAQKPILADSSWDPKEDENISTRLGQCITRYSHCNQVLSQLNSNHSFICELTEKYKNSGQLVDFGLIQKPQDFA